jgi:cytochrome b6
VGVPGSLGVRTVRRIYQFLDERLALEPLVEYARRKEVPRHRFSWAYFFGGLTLFFFIVQVCSGILLLLYYRPTAEAAFDSVQFIMTRVRFGWLVRSVHSWSANLMILAAFVHMFSVFLMKAYGRPRELTWWTGCVLLALSMGFGFSGYLLPWNELAFMATSVGTEMVHQTPLVGGWLLRFLRGGEEVTGATLTRFFGFHVAVLPMLTTTLLLAHLLFVQRQGMHVPSSARAENRRRPAMRFIPNFMLRELLVWLIGLALLAALAACFPWELGRKADPFASAPPGIKPDWYFLFVFETLKLLPAYVFGLEGELIGLAAFGLVAVLWLLVPVFDRRTRHGERSPLFTLIGCLTILYIAGMTLLSVAGRLSK